MLSETSLTSLYQILGSLLFLNRALVPSFPFIYFALFEHDLITIIITLGHCNINLITRSPFLCSFCYTNWHIFLYLWDSLSFWIMPYCLLRSWGWLLTLFSLGFLGLLRPGGYFHPPLPNFCSRNSKSLKFCRKVVFLEKIPKTIFRHDNVIILDDVSIFLLLLLSRVCQ